MIRFGFGPALADIPADPPTSVRVRLVGTRREEDRRT